MKQDEQILVTTDYLMESLGKPQGFTTDLERYAPLLDRRNQIFVPRQQVENQPLFKQIIPYVVVMRWPSRTEKKDIKILPYCRLKNGNEGRLRGKSSIGFGGHLNENLEPGTITEILEELWFHDYDNPVKDRIRLTGILYDEKKQEADGVPVGNVHLGVVMVLWCDDIEEKITSNEHDKIELLPWVSVEDLKFNIPNMSWETWDPWSRILIENIDSLVDAPDGRASFRDLDDHFATGQMLALRRGKRCMIGGNSIFNGIHGHLDLYGHCQETRGWAAHVIRDGGGAIGPVYRHQIFTEKEPLQPYA